MVEINFSMFSRLLLAMLIVSSFTSRTKNDDVIQWKSTYRLNWSDFKAPPPANAANAALTSSGIMMKFGTDGESLHYEISCNFVKNNSWGRIRNEHILAHEQGHFDIAEIFARKLNKELKAYRFNSRSVSKDVNNIYKNVMDQLLQMQNLYDEQTDFSRNFGQQKEWLEKIDNYLTALNDYAGYDYVST